MSTRVIDQISEYVTPEIVSKASSLLGESENGISKSISVAIPAVLSGLLNKSNNNDLMHRVMSLIHENKNGANASNFSALLTKESDKESIGSRLMYLLFGDKLNTVTEWIAKAGGIGNSSASSLLGLVGPMVLGYFAKSGAKSSEIQYLLSSQKDSILSDMPLGLIPALGFDDLDKRKKKHDDKNKRPTWLIPLLLLVLAIVAIYFLMRSCNKPNVNKAITVDKIDTLEAKIDTAVVKTGNATDFALEKLGTFFTFRLPNGVKLNVPKYGVENQIVTWMNDDTKIVDKTTWFNFDRLLFETGKSTLTPNSQEQLKNIAEILKAYPSMEIKLGGYTDNTGNAAVNLKLSDERAKSVMQQLIGLGVASKKVAAEGYGDQFPVTSNDTEEGRAQNRRISIRVTKK